MGPPACFWMIGRSSSEELAGSKKQWKQRRRAGRLQLVAAGPTRRTAWVIPLGKGYPACGLGMRSAKNASIFSRLPLTYRCSRARSFSKDWKTAVLWASRWVCRWSIH